MICSLALAIFAFASVPASAAYLQCAPFARQVSGIQLFGNAAGWWGQASGKYARGDAPEVGSVLVFKATGAMRVGHVAMVSEIVSDREIRVTHANWSIINGRRGQIERDVRVIDASPAGDWSQVKVWYAPIRGLGIKSYPVYGFVYADKPADPVRMAALDSPKADVPALRGMVLASIPTRTLLP
jgi:surface antigen